MANGDRTYRPGTLIEGEARYLIDPQSTDEQLRNDQNCLLSIVESLSSNLADALDGQDSIPGFTAGMLANHVHGLRWLVRMAMGVGGELDRRAHYSR
jgi:hypothetical protein